MTWWLILITCFVCVLLLSFMIALFCAFVLSGRADRELEEKRKE